MVNGLVGHVVEMALVQVTTLPGDDFETVVRSLKITPSFGPIWYTALDLGTPAVDENSTPYPNDSGTYDATKFSRARAVSLSVTVSDDWFPPSGTDLWDARWNSSSYWVKELGRWSAAGFRCWLYLRFAGDSSPYRIDLSGRGQAAPIATTDRTIRAVQLNWSSPSGLLREFSEDTDSSRVSKDGRLRKVIGYGGSALGGVTFPITLPMSFPSGYIVGSGGPIDYDGTVATGLIVRAHAAGGNLTNPRITVTPPSGAARSIGFQGLVIPDGHYAELDTERKMLTIDGDARQPIATYLNGPPGWLQLEPGANVVDFTTDPNADGSSSDLPGVLSYAEALYYPASV